MKRRSMIVGTTLGVTSALLVAAGCSSFAEQEAAPAEAGVVETGTADVVVPDSPPAEAAPRDAGADAAHFCERYGDASETLCADFDEGQVANYGLGVPSTFPPSVDLAAWLTPPGSMRADDDGGAKVSNVAITSPKPIDANLSPKRRLSFDLYVDRVVLAGDGSGPYLAGLHVGEGASCMIQLEQFELTARLVLTIPGLSPQTLSLPKAVPGGWRHFDIEVEYSTARYVVKGSVDGQVFTFINPAIQCGSVDALTMTGYVGIAKAAGGVVVHYDNVVFDTPP